MNKMPTMNATKTVSPCAECDFLHKPKDTDVCAGCDRRISYWHSISGECYHIDTTSIRRMSEITGLVHVGGRKTHKERTYRNGVKQDVIDKMLVLYRQGLAARSISNTLGVNYGVVNRYLYSKRYTVLTMDDRLERLSNGGTFMPDTIRAINAKASATASAKVIK